MSDYVEDLPEPGSPGDLRAKFEQEQAARAADAEEAAAREAAITRELAFTKAGINVDTPAGQIFFKGYDGEMEVEAIQTAAAAMNLTTAAPAAPPADGPTLEPTEASVLGAGAELGGTAPPPEAPPADPNVEAQAVFDRAHDEGMGRMEAIGLGLNSLANAAQRGDNRVIVPSR